MKPTYGNFQNYSFRFDPAACRFELFYHRFDDETEKVFLSGRVLTAGGLAQPEGLTVTDRSDFRTDRRYTVFSGERGGTPLFEITFELDREEIRLRCSGDVSLEGLLHWGENVADTISGVYAGDSPVLQGASGPAVRAGDDMLFDRKEDRILRFIPEGKFELAFDWDENAYAFRSGRGRCVSSFALRLQVREHFVAESMHMRYTPINKHSWFATAPVGWMTWYATRFDACEAEVLENTRKMKELLGPYTDNLVSWVDWEWYHPRHGAKDDAGCDIFEPRKDAYPHGMAYVAKKIEEAGCIPAIWIAPTNEPRKNKWFKAHPDCVLGPWPTWSGQWWIDPSRPEIFSEYIPMVIRQMLDWGYRAIKWDCLSSNPAMWSYHHDELADPSVSPEQYAHKVVAAGRRAAGDDVFMLFCNPVTDNEMATGTDVFDAARIGGDVFGWYEFCERAIDRLFHFFPIHNTILYTDGDNIVLREEYNTVTQAQSRVSFYGLTGLPVTVGDRFREYDETRIDMLRRIVPVVDVTPVEFRAKFPDGASRKIVTAFSRPFGDWQVAALVNTRENPLELTLDFAADCRLETGEGRCYAVYDYWKGQFLGVHERSVSVKVAPFETAVLRITPVADDMLPTLVSSSRHITQGGYELVDMKRDVAGGVLRGVVKCVPGEPCRLSFLVPEGMEIAASGGVWEKSGPCGVLTILKKEGGEAAWKLKKKK